MRHLIVILGLGCLLITAPVSAATWTIQDDYIGGGYVKNGPYTQKKGDVIAAATQINKFDIDNMIVDIDNLGNIKVTVTTDYNPNDSDISWLGTQFGDLFISTDGWYPRGTEPYKKDNFGNTGTDWEFVFDTNTGNFYKTSDGAFLLSQDFHSNRPDSWYRKKQLVQIDPNKLDALVSNPVTTGTFEMKTDEAGNNILVYYGFSLTDMGLDLTETYDLAFRWTMTCANDIIEGSVTWKPVPEPGTMVLLGIGMIGLGAMGRKKLIG